MGTRAALGPRAGEVTARTMARLGLGSAESAWHTARDNIAETASFFAILTSTLEKIANEIIQLGKTEIGELSEPAPGKSLSSSTMPHKKNPVICQRIAVLARHVRSLAGIVMDGMVHEHERDARALWSEWLAMPQISMYTGTGLNYLNSVMAGLAINPERMLANLALQKESVVSEWLLFRLAEKIGKMKAQKKLHDLFQRSAESGRPLKEMLAADPELGPLLSADDYDYLDHPENYTGHSAAIIDSVVDDSVKKRRSDPESITGPQEG